MAFVMCVMCLCTLVHRNQGQYTATCDVSVTTVLTETDQTPKIRLDAIDSLVQHPLHPDTLFYSDYRGSAIHVWNTSSGEAAHDLAMQPERHSLTVSKCTLVAMRVSAANSARPLIRVR